MWKQDKLKKIDDAIFNRAKYSQLLFCFIHKIGLIA